MKLTYLITYYVLSIEGKPVKEGTIKCKNRDNEFDAKVQLEKHLQKKVPNFHRLVITSCKLDIDPMIAQDFFDILQGGKKKKTGNWYDDFFGNGSI